MSKYVEKYFMLSLAPYTHKLNNYCEKQKEKKVSYSIHSGIIKIKKYLLCELTCVIQLNSSVNHNSN